MKGLSKSSGIASPTASRVKESSVYLPAPGLVKKLYVTHATQHHVNPRSFSLLAFLRAGTAVSLSSLPHQGPPDLKILFQLIP